MSPYLFILTCGIYDTYVKTVEYPDGDTFRLELLLFPGACSREDAVTAIDAVHDSILWTYTSTGPETYEHVEERKEMTALLEERQALLEKYASTVTLNDEAVPTRADMSEEDAARLAAVRARLAELAAVWTETGYKVRVVAPVLRSGLPDLTHRRFPSPFVRVICVTVHGSSVP